MKILHIDAFNRDDAARIAKEKGLLVVKNVTKAWNEAGRPTPGTVSFRAFASNELMNHYIAGNDGYALLIIQKGGALINGKRPYKMHNFKQVGDRKIRRIYRIYNANTNQLLGSALYKDEAMNVAKRIIKDVRQTLVCRLEYIVNGDDRAFQLNYKAPVKARIGHYVVFGNPKEDE